MYCDSASAIVVNCVSLFMFHSFKISLKQITEEILKQDKSGSVKIGCLTSISRIGNKKLHLISSTL